MIPRRLVGCALALAAALARVDARAVAPAPAPRPRVVTVCSDPWMPYTGSGVPGSDEGYVIALTREALRRGGLEIRYVAMPWSRCLADVEAGRWDAIACADHSEAKGAAYPEEPIGVSTPVVFTGPRSTWRYLGLPSLDGIRLGAVQNYTYTDDVDGWIKEHAGDPRRLFLAAGAEPLRRLMDMLGAGRVDAIIENGIVARWAAHRAGLPADFLREAGTTGPPVPIYLAFSRHAADHQALQRAFDAGLRSMKADGSLATLLARYQVPPWPAPKAARP
jgi:polar amino acid transport system substrate-binding protein